MNSLPEDIIDVDAKKECGKLTYIPPSLSHLTHKNIESKTGPASQEIPPTTPTLGPS
ncbi:hypothetical protein [Celerinatantimonas sp. YJH-8]|uniref:hypothetical protein n=1 Tax=Celerinatantimonas sp. YJH-8 TaxID=3228714 RepID=UPI0038CA8FE8